MQMNNGEFDETALPTWVASLLDYELAEVTRNWQRVELSDGLHADDVRMLSATRMALLIPDIMWWYRRDDVKAQQLRQWLSRNAHTRTIEYWRSPIDRLFAHIGPLKSMARRAEIGHLYVLDPCDRVH
jgi:hypothetical protein